MTAKELLRERVESLSEEEAEEWLGRLGPGRRLSPVEIARLPVEERWQHVHPETWEVDMEEFLEWEAATVSDGLDITDD